MNFGSAVRNPHLLLAIYSLIVSGAFHVGHGITVYMDTSVLMFIRFALGAAVFSIYVFSCFKVKKPDIPDLARYFIISASLAGYFWAMFEALKFTSPLNTGVIYTIVPFFSALYGYFILKEKVPPAKMFMLMLATFGAVWVIINGSQSPFSGFRFNKGDLLFLAGCASMGLYSPLSKKLHRDEPTPVLTFWTMATGAVWFLLIANVKIVRTDWSVLPPELLLGIAYITLLSSIATFFIVQYSSRLLPVSKVMSYIYFTPVLVILIGMLLGKEMPSAAVIPGAVISLACTYYFLRGKY
jgi:drug/metabolite transporter (DMT)-like permease